MQTPPQVVSYSYCFEAHQSATFQHYLEAPLMESSRLKRRHTLTQRSGIFNLYPHADPALSVYGKHMLDTSEH